MGARAFVLALLSATPCAGDSGEQRPRLETGLTRAQIAEAMTHLGFYAGWTKAAKAINVVARTLGQ